MLTHSPIRWACVLAIAALLATGSESSAQTVMHQPLQFEVSGPSQRLEMIVRTSRILTVAAKIPRALVNDPEVVSLTPLSPTQIQLSALQPGVTQVNLWDENGQVHSVDVVVYADTRQLEMLISQQFPNSIIKVTPMNSGVMLTGMVDNPNDVGKMISMAEEYYPTVLNNITVGGVQQVLLHVEIMEVSRTKLNALGFDWAAISGSDFVIQSVSGLISAVAADAGSATGVGGASVRFGLVDGSDSFFGFIEALRQNNLAKILAEPTLVAESGRPASFNSGGEVPTLIPGGLGTVTIEYHQYGTRVDFVPIVLGNGTIHLEVRPQVSELDAANSITVDNITIPGFKTRWVDTAVEMQAGQTLAIAGLIQTRIETENKGLPFLADLPWAGAAFRRVEQSVNEVELLVLVTPELVEPMDPCQVPGCGPGMNTATPSECELYFRGYTEVPNCGGGGCSFCPSGGMGSEYIPQSGYEQLQTPSASPESAGAMHRLPSGTPREPASTSPQTPMRATSAESGTDRSPYDHYERQNQQSASAAAGRGSSRELYGPIGYGDLD